jgi:hypothetical protein
MIPIQNTPIWTEFERLIEHYVKSHPQEFDAPEDNHEFSEWDSCEVPYIVKGILRYPQDAIAFVEEQCGEEGAALLEQMHEGVCGSQRN